MKLVDLNVLLYAVDSHSPHHATVKRWWETALDEDEPIGLAWIVLLGFLKVSTNPRAFTRPLTPEQATSQLDEWLARDRVLVVAESAEHWRVLRALIAEAGTAGNLTTDAHLAAMAITRGASLISCDADFGRFRSLRWISPLA